MSPNRCRPCPRTEHLSRPSTSLAWAVPKSWMPGTRPGMTEQMSPSDAISEPKTIVRKDARMRRDGIPAAKRAQASEAIAARAFPLAIRPGTIFSGFMPLKTEINPLPLMRKLEAAGARLGLPANAGLGKPPTLRALAVGRQLASVQRGTRQ